MACVYARGGTATGLRLLSRCVTDEEARCFNERSSTRRTPPRLADPVAFREPKTARPTPGRFHDQTLTVTAQAPSNMVQMCQDILFWNTHLSGEIFGRGGTFL
jgi:hypothetical protein